MLGQNAYLDWKSYQEILKCHKPAFMVQHINTIITGNKGNINSIILYTCMVDLLFYKIMDTTSVTFEIIY